MVVTVKNRFFPSNTYILANGNNKECIIIDPGLDAQVIESKISELDVVPTDILSTHGHFDHAGSAAFFQKKYNAKFHLHESDSRLLKSLNFFLKMMKIDLTVDTPVPDQLLNGDELLELNSYKVKVFNFPGHTPGSCLFLIDHLLFTGDILYSEGVGFNPFPGQDKKSLQKSVKEIFALFEDELIVYPGHGRSEKLSQIKLHNTELKKFLEVEY